MKDYVVKDFRKDRWNGFKQYYVWYLYCGGCDPAYDVINYFCEKERIPLSDRYLLSLLYGSTYSDSATYTIYKRFPDILNMRREEIESIWFKYKDKIKFTSDRKKVHHFNELPKIIESYKKLLGGKTQEDFFNEYVNLDISPEDRYRKVYDVCNQIYYFGRFSLFNYLETLNEVTPLKIYPDILCLEEAESARNGLCYAMSLDNQVTLHHKKPIDKINYEFLYDGLKKLKIELQKENPEINVTYFNIETALCGYKKLFWKTRYLGYYIDRHGASTLEMEQLNPDISFDFIWEFRDKYLLEYFNKTFIDKNKNRLGLMMNTGKLVVENTLIGNENKLDFKEDNLIPHLRKPKHLKAN